MPPPTIPLAARYRAFASHPSSTTLSHVLGLLQNGYLDKASRVAVAQIRRSSGVAGSGSGSGVGSSSIGSTQSSSSSLERRSMSQRQNFRTYSASAAQTVDHESQDYHQHHHSSPSTSDQSSSSTFHHFSTPFSDRPHRSKYTSSQPNQPIRDQAITKDKKFFVAFDYPDAWSMLPEDFYSRLYNGAFQSASHFSHDFELKSFETRHLGSIGNLLGVFALFRDTAEHEDWLWLITKLDRLTDILDNVKPPPRQRGLQSLVCSIRGYALAFTGDSEKAKEVLGNLQYLDSRNPGNTLPTSYSIAALAYVEMGEWELAMKRMRGAIDRAVQRMTSNDATKLRQECDYPSFDFGLLQSYEKSVLDASRNDDLIELVRTASYTVRKFLINSTQRHHPFSMQLTDLLLGTLARVGSPVEWWTDRFNADSSVNTRTLGIFLFIAITRDRTKIQEAINLLDIFIANGTSVPTSAAINLCSLLVTESTSDAWKLYQRICQEYPNFTHGALSQAMRLAGQAGWVEEEQRLWNQISTNYTPTGKDRLVAARYHAYRGRVADTLAMLETRVGPNFESKPAALEILFTAYINANNSQGAERVLNQINAIEPRIYPYNALLQLYADQVNVEAAVRLFDELSNSTLRPDIHSYTSLISLFAHRRDPVNADNVFQAMIDAGIEPDAIAHAAVIDAEVETGEWVAALDRYNRLPRQFKHHQAVSTAIIKALVALSSPPEHVMSVFRRITNPNRHTWALVIQNACDASEMEVARELYEEMDEMSKSNKGPSPDAYAFSILLHGYMRLGDGASARAVYDEMLSREVLPSSVTYGMIVKSFAEARGERSLEQAHDFAMNVSKQAKAGNIADRRHEKALINQNIFSPLVVAHGKNQNFDMAQKYFDLAQDGSGENRESVHMYTQLMDVYRRAGDSDKVLEIWNKTFQLACDTASFRKSTSGGEQEGGTSSTPALTSRSNDNVLCIPLSIALDSLSISGNYLQVKKIWNDVQDAGFGFDAGNYNHLSVALARTGDVEGAFKIADQILLRRYEEIKFRKNEAMRDAQNLKSVQIEQDLDHQDLYDDALELAKFDITDRPVEPFQGPPNRRHMFHGRSPFTSEARNDPTSELELKLLSSWRPSDILWRPSLLTISVLDTAYAQLEDAKARRAWLPLSISDENENEDAAAGTTTSGSVAGGVEGGERKKRTYGIVLPLFGGVPVRNHYTGQPHRKGPTELLKSINKRYARLVGLIMFHRKKRMARKIRDRQGR
ncbi:hypothetical protein I203_108560 [Kwoniella mangroviensis CBS 8507]|uniref:hypothetical protein n=1 Tax=Kwoniella mangroviensis CBS 8507 TaxID=1296122 RepID=UPI00305F67A9